MICKACGYEHETEWVGRINSKIGPEEILIKGKNPFVKVEGTFLVKDDSSYGPTRTNQVSLYACPECLTLRLREDCV